MVFLVLIGLLYPPPAWKVLFEARKVPQMIFFRRWSCTLVSSLVIWEEKKQQTQRTLAGHFHFWIASIPWTCPVCPMEIAQKSGQDVPDACPPNRPLDISAYRAPISSLCSLFIGFLLLTSYALTCCDLYMLADSVCDVHTPPGHLLRLFLRNGLARQNTDVKDQNNLVRLFYLPAFNGNF